MEFINIGIVMYLVPYGWDVAIFQGARFVRHRSRLGNKDRWIRVDLVGGTGV